MNMVLGYKKHLKFKVYKIRYIYTFFLISLIVLYSFSSPWPRNIGLIEIFVGLILVLTFWKPFINYIFNFSIKSIERYIFLYMLIIGSLMSIPSNNIQDYIRDLIPLFYFFIGYAIIQTNFKYKYIFLILPYITTYLGFLYSIRTILYWKDKILLLGTGYLASPDYIAQSPSITFASSFFILNGIYMFFKNKIHYSLILIGLGLLCLLPVAGQILRAPIGLILFFSLLFLLSLYFTYVKKNPIIVNLKTITLFFIISAFFISNLDIIISILNLLLEKHKNYGSNGKIEEYFYAIDYLSYSIFTFIFGEGLGGLWLTPFSKSIKLSFAHSFIVYSMIKWGFIGLIMSLYIVLRVFYFSFKLMNCKDIKLKIIGYSSLPTLIINFFLEAGYKTLSFGLIIACIILYYHYYIKRIGNVPKSIQV